MGLASGKHTRLVVLVPWWFPPKVTITRKDVVRFKNALRWRRIDITAGAREEIERLREEHKFDRYSVARIALLIAFSKLPIEGAAEMARDPRIEDMLGPVEGAGADWRGCIKENHLVEEVRDVTDDAEYKPWRKFVEAAAKKGANGRIILRRPGGESVVIMLGHPTVVAPAYEEIKDERLELVKNETNLSDDELKPLLEIAFKLRE